ncbi:MAG: hypothetical protein RQ842_08095 [Vulcanisaeta sp.]|jgi:hypothetical protein|nr:hypothetical protein [Vulcanisaeta sp.]
MPGTSLGYIEAASRALHIPLLIRLTVPRAMAKVNIHLESIRDRKKARI